MSVLSPKTRLVSFRLSEKDYEELRVMCLAQQARSLSDFVRDSMQRFIHMADSPQTGSPPEGRRTLFDEYGHRSVVYLQQESAMQSIASLTGMLWALHRRTEALDRQVSRLMLLMQDEIQRHRPEPDGEQGMEVDDRDERRVAVPLPGRG